MRQYLNLLSNILDHGILQPNRTGVDTLTLPGAMLKFDLRAEKGGGFPAVTTKKLAFNQVKGELIAFLQGSNSLAQFKKLGCDVWDANVASPQWQNNPHCTGPDDMGSIYGVQWRAFAGYEGLYGMRCVDQIQVALDLVRNNPTSRRIVVTAWNPAELDQACLPPCHVLFQLLPHPSSKTLHMTMYQRSCDMFLGVPFNIASYALLLHLFSAWTGYTAGTLTMFLADAHIYVNHIEQAKEQLSRTPKIPPALSLLFPHNAKQMDIDEILAKLEPDDIQLVDYLHHPAIKAPMAV